MNFENIQIFKKVCKEGQDCSDSSITCFEPSALCAAKKDCSDSCSDFRHDSKAQYQLDQQLTLTITENHFFQKPKEQIQVVDSNLIVIKSKGGKIAHRNTKAGEKPDSKVTKIGEKFIGFAMSQVKDVKDTKHLLRIIISEPIELVVPHEYTESGHYKISMSINNLWSKEAISYDNDISVQSSISNIKLTVNPQNAAVDQKVDVIIQLTKGSNIKVSWDYGDGQIDQEEILSKSNSIFSTIIYYF